MRPPTRRRRIGITLGLLACLASVPAPAEEDGGATTTQSLLKGKVLGADGKTPIAGAEVVLYHLSSERSVSSPPSGSKGTFEISGLTYGYFDLAVVTGDGLYVANQVINVPPSGKAVVVLVLRRFAATTPSSDRRSFPGTDEVPAGVAMLSEKLVGAAFWRSPKGLALAGGAGGGLLLLLASGSDRPVSPFTP